MKILLQLLKLSLILFLVSSCAEGEFFGPKKTPLAGKRLNVLHYDLLQDNKITTKEAINILAQRNLSSWDISDIGQFTGLPENISLASELKLETSFTLDGFSKSSGSSMIIINNIIYTYSRNILSAYDTAENKNIWSVKSINSKEKDDIISGSLAYDSGVIYLTSGARDLVAYNASDGKELWRFQAPNVIRHIALIYNDKIYFSGTDNTLSCLDLNGNLIWRYDAAIYSLTTNRIYIPNIVYEDKVINITTAGDLVVLNRYDGAEITQVNLATTAIIGDGSLAKGPLVSPILNGSHLYILTGESDFIKIDLANPQILWRHNFPEAKSYWVTDKVTYMITRNNQLLAMDNKAGEIIWVEELNNNSNNKDSSEFYGPILAGNQLVITSRDGDLLMISPYDGKEITRYKNNSPTHQMPIIVNEKVYLIGNRGLISVWQ